MTAYSTHRQKQALRNTLRRLCFAPTFCELNALFISSHSFPLPLFATQIVADAHSLRATSLNAIKRRQLPRRRVSPSYLYLSFFNLVIKTLFSWKIPKMFSIGLG